MRVVKLIAYVVIYLTGLAILGILNVAQLGWDWSVVTKQWLLELNLYNVLYYSFFVNTLMLGMDILATDDKLSQVVTSIEALRPKVEGQKLRKFVDEINWFEKCQKHIEKITIKKSKLAKKYLSNGVSLYLAYGKPKTIKKCNIFKKVYWFAVGRKTAKYTKKNERLNQQLTDEWVNQNLMFTKVVYPEVEYAELLYGSTKSKNKKSRFKRSYIKTQVIVKAPLLILSSVGTIIMTVVKILEFHDIRNLLFDLGIVLIILSINILTGAISSMFSHKARIVDTQERLELLIAFQDNSYTKLKELPKREQQKGA